MSVYAKAIENYNKCLEKNTLISKVEVKGYKIHVPDRGSMGSFYVIFTPAGICIHGDWCPLRHGVCSDPGYGEAWFSNKKSDSYLAEKFLDTGWYPELAIEEMKSPGWWGRESLVELGKESNLPKIDELCERLESGDLSSKEMGARLYSELEEIGLDPWEDLPGCGYCPRQLGMLVAIHTKFVELKAKGGFAMMNLPQPTITGLLNGSITRVFEVCDPQPEMFRVPTCREPHWKTHFDGVMREWICWDGTATENMLRFIQRYSPFGEPGTIHTIGGQQFEVVESGVFQMDNSFKYAANPSNAEALLAALPDNTPNDTWLWTAELRRKDEDDE